MRQVPANLYDILQMLDALEVSRIVPAEVPITGAADERTYRFYPVWMGEALDPLLHRGLYFGKDVSTT
jgi:hypothetical protein